MWWSKKQPDPKPEPFYVPDAEKDEDTTWWIYEDGPGYGSQRYI